ncbi:MAG TPA: AraC family transcriptional regulator [Pedobacter sp.]|jgi:AraC-like DNA-binding protein
MKPQLLKVEPGLNYSFSIRHDTVPYFHNRWHYHPEIELLYVEKGSGTQFVGDSIQRFSEGDVLLIGSNLPHYWRCDESYFQNSPDIKAEATVVHFLPTFWSEKFLDLPENKKIRELFDVAKRGVSIAENVRNPLIKILKQMLSANETERIILLLQALTLIISSQSNTVLSSVGFENVLQQDEKDTINKIYAYSLAHFKEKILLEEIAAIAHISPNSFCRYFKTRTRKTYSRFLQELRIGYVCKQLIETDLTLTQVCYNSGFNNLTNFYKCFKSITNKTPYEYKKEFEKSS